MGEIINVDFKGRRILDSEPSAPPALQPIPPSNGDHVKTFEERWAEMSPSERTDESVFILEQYHHALRYTECFGEEPSEMASIHYQTEALRNTLGTEEFEVIEGAIKRRMQMPPLVAVD